MRDVRFHASDTVVLSITWLRGELVSTVPGRPPVFDDQRSFLLEIQDAELTLDPSSLTALVNRAFDYEGSALSRLVVEIENGRLKQRGKLRKGISIPFAVESELAVNDDGRLRLHPVKVEAAGIPSKKLMSMLRIELDDLIKGNGERGIARWTPTT